MPFNLYKHFIAYCGVTFFVVDIIIVICHNLVYMRDNVLILK